MGISSDTFYAPAGALVDSAPPFAVPTRELVLIVEDDDAIAGLLERILEAMSLGAMRAGSAEEAEALFAAKSGEVAVAIVDCGLPDMDGRALCRRLRQRAPGLPVVLTSGSDTESEGATPDRGRTVFLPKPFFPSEVRRQLRALLSITG
jgi:DNA-binding response OmpR family regulator